MPLPHHASPDPRAGAEHIDQAVHALHGRAFRTTPPPFGAGLGPHRQWILYPPLVLWPFVVLFVSLFHELGVLGSLLLLLVPMGLWLMAIRRHDRAGVTWLAPAPEQWIMTQRGRQRVVRYDTITDLYRDARPVMFENTQAGTLIDLRGHADGRPFRITHYANGHGADTLFDMFEAALYAERTRLLTAALRSGTTFQLAGYTVDTRGITPAAGPCVPWQRMRPPLRVGREIKFWEHGDPRPFWVLDSAADHAGVLEAIAATWAAADPPATAVHRTASRGAEAALGYQLWTRDLRLPFVYPALLVVTMVSLAAILIDGTDIAGNLSLWGILYAPLALYYLATRRIRRLELYEHALVITRFRKETVAFADLIGVAWLNVENIYRGAYAGSVAHVTLIRANQKICRFSLPFREDVHAPNLLRDRIEEAVRHTLRARLQAGGRVRLGRRHFLDSGHLYAARGVWSRRVDVVSLKDLTVTPDADGYRLTHPALPRPLKIADRARNARPIYPLLLALIGRETGEDGGIPMREEGAL